MVNDWANKEGIDLYLEMSSLRFTQFNKRRDFEFKMNLSVWTVLAIVVGFMYRTGPAPGTGLRECFVIVGVLVLVVLYAIWMYNIHKANHSDFSVAVLAMERAERLLGTHEYCLLASEAGLGSWASSTSGFKPEKPNLKYFYLEVLTTVFLSILGILLTLWTHSATLSTQ
jgi:hypothetical protein